MKTKDQVPNQIEKVGYHHWYTTEEFGQITPLNEIEVSGDDIVGWAEAQLSETGEIRHSSSEKPIFALFISDIKSMPQNSYSDVWKSITRIYDIATNGKLMLRPK